MSSPYDFSFRKLMEAAEGTDTDALFTDLLRHGPSLFDSLSMFILEEEQNPRVAVLVRLLGKTMDDRAIPMLMRLLDSDNVRTRRAAANALGWNRAPASLEALDRLAGTDSDSGVRQEAHAAIEEILRDYPGMKNILRHHTPEGEAAGEQRAAASQTTEGPATPKQKSPAEKLVDQEKLKLIMALPRLLAFKYRAVPLRFAAADQLHLAIETGRERRMIAPVSAVTGLNVTLTAWPMERVHEQIEKLYTLGDDDFVSFFERLNPVAQRELYDIIRAGIHPNEPASPLDETNDGVEAMQSLLSSCISLHAASATVFMEGTVMRIAATKKSGGTVNLNPPAAAIRERLVKTLKIVCEYPADHQKGALTLKYAGCAIAVRLACSKTSESEKLSLEFKAS